MLEHKMTVPDGRRDWVCHGLGCRQAFGRKTSILGHQRNVLERAWDWVCDSLGCGEAFGRKCSLKRHQNSRCRGQGAALPQHASLPLRKRKRDDDATETSFSSPCDGSICDGDDAAPLPAIRSRKRRPLASPTLPIQEAFHALNIVAVSHLCSNHVSPLLKSCLSST